MGQLAKQAAGSRLAKNNMGGDLKSLIEGNWPRIAAVLPNHMSAERMMQLAISTINKNPKLAQCDAASILSCFMTASSLGLEPNDVNGLGQCYIIPYGKTATFVPGYRGLYKLALNSGEIESITVEAVYEGDEFDYQMGDDAHITHKPSMTAEHSPEKLVCCYCITRLKNGGIQRSVMGKRDIEKRRKASKGGNSGPWATWYEEMAKKTVMRNAAKHWPLSAEKSVQLQRAIAVDETSGGYEQQIAFDPVFEAPEEEPEPARDTEPKGLRKAHCTVCGHVFEIAVDADLADLDPAMIACCETPNYEWMED